MKIVEQFDFGTPGKVVRCVEAPDPGPPGDDEVVVEIEAFPINPADVLTLTGDYATRPALPSTLGAEGVGRVTAAGAAVETLAVGDRVIPLDRDNWVQAKKLPAAKAIKVPEADVLQLAMLKVNPATALLMLTGYVELTAGDTVIQDAANSGVGLSLIKLAKARGIATVNVVRRESLIAPLRDEGADHVVVDGPDLAERVKAATGGAAIKLAIDAVAGSAVMRLADCLADGGTVVNYGLLSGEPCMLRADQTVFHGITLTGFWLSKELPRRSAAELTALYGELAGMVASGALHVPVAATYPIERIAEAVEHAAQEGRDGKVLVTPNAG